MYIDILNQYDDNEFERLMDLSHRWVVREYHSGHNWFDMHEYFPDAPYWGDGRYYDKDGEATDPDYFAFFYNIINDDDLFEVKQIRAIITKQTEQFEKSEEWIRLPSISDFKKTIFYLEQKNITYVVIKGYPEMEEYVFIKRLEIPIAIYAMNCPWLLKDVTSEMFIKERWVTCQKCDIIASDASGNVRKWLDENATGCYFCQGNTLWFEHETDMAATKLRWY